MLLLSFGRDTSLIPILSPIPATSTSQILTSVTVELVGISCRTVSTFKSCKLFIKYWLMAAVLFSLTGPYGNNTVTGGRKREYADSVKQAPKCQAHYLFPFLRNLLNPAKIRLAAEIPIMVNNATNGVLSPVFGESLVFVGVPCSSGAVGDSSFSLTVTVCPSSLMSLCSATLIGSSGWTYRTRYHLHWSFRHWYSAYEIPSQQR